MKLRYKIIICLSVFLIALGVILFFNIPRLSFEYNEEYDAYLVSHAYGDSSEYFIPSEYNGKDVCGFSSRAFYKHKVLEKITFEDSSKIKIIGRLAFSECDNLKEIDLSYVQNIERGAFSYDYLLDNITIGSSMIAGSAFYKCKGLRNITLNNTINIGSMAFAETNIEEIAIPKSCTTIGIDAFIYCDNLNNIYLYQQTLNSNSHLNSYNISIISE